MRANKFELMAIGLASALSAQSSLAQSSEQASPPQPGKSKEASAQVGAMQPGEVRLSKLLGADVKSSSDEDLGKVKDLMVDLQTGKIRFAILGRGGVLGIAEKHIPVPWQAATVQSEKQLTLNVDKDKLNSAPTLRSDYSDLNNPGYRVSVYQFFDIQSSAVGAPGETPGGTSSGSSNSKENSPRTKP